jgi:hypothetical protein
MILTAIGWIAALGLLSAAVSSGWHGWREKTRGPWIGAGLYACGAVVLLAVDGVLKPFSAGALAFLALAAAGTLAVFDGRSGGGWKGVAGSARGGAGAGLGYLGADAKGIWRRVMGRFSGEDEPAETVAVVAEHVATRNIPSVMEDPFLGAPMQAAEIAAASPSVPVPAPWLALAQYIAERDPEDDQDLRMFSDGDAAGALAIAEAYHAFAGHCLNGIGLSPAYVAGVLEAGDSAGGHATLMTQVHRRFQVIYDELKGWIATNGPLPHKARTFLTDSD